MSRLQLLALQSCGESYITVVVISSEQAAVEARIWKEVDQPDVAIIS
jgi:hypothetical protein